MHYSEDDRIYLALDRYLICLAYEFIASIRWVSTLIDLAE
jgi:hypothetical protein